MNPIPAPEERALLVVFFDLTNYTKLSGTLNPRDLFGTMSAFFERVGDVLEPAGGTIVKFMGDAGLAVFPEEAVDAGVRALLELRESTDRWFAERGFPNRMILKAHFGPVLAGAIGTRRDKRFDVYGETVNIAATLPSCGISISPEAFRKLVPETRRLFKKHTPAVRYIPVEERHRD